MTTKYQPGDYEAVHENPAWRDRANFIIAAYLGEKEGRSEWEQLWVRRLEDRKFIICCIPFFVFDLALGDAVETDENYVLTRVACSAGNFTFRVWFGNSKKIGIKEEIEAHCAELGVTTEWSSPNLLAINAAGMVSAQALADYLQEQQDNQLLTYETGRTAESGSSSL